MRKAKSTKAPEVKPKKEPTEFQKRARAKNLEKAREVNVKKKLAKDIANLNEGISDVSDKIDTEVEKQVKAHLKTVDKKKLKNEILAVFDDIGGRKFVRKWAKDNPGKYLNLVNNILKVDNEKQQSSGGVTVEIFTPPGLTTVDITPSKDN